jgi:hypothetical protein
MLDQPESPVASPLAKDVRRRTSATDFGSLWLAVGQTTVRTLDRALRSILGIVEFSTHEDCVLRIAPRRAPAAVCVPGRIEVRKSAEVIELHFWNENLPVLYPCGSPFGWAVRFRRQMHLSLQVLAAHAVTDPRIMNANAFYARMVLPLDGRLYKCAAVAEDFGFSVIKLPCSAIQRVHDAFENLLVRALIWTFHPGKLTRRPVPLERVYWWISREDLLSRYRHDFNSDTEIGRIANGVSFFAQGGASKPEFQPVGDLRSREHGEVVAPRESWRVR